MCDVESEPFVYEARYGLGGRTGLIIVIAFVFAILGIVLPLSTGLTSLGPRQIRTFGR